MDRKKVAVIFGGMSSEYEVSLQSAYAVIRHIDRRIYEPVPIGISREGEWFHYSGNPVCILEDEWRKQRACVPAHLSPCRYRAGLVERKEGEEHFIEVDVAFPVLHGIFGEDGTVQGLLELAGIPIVGCGTLASALCMDKNMAHLVARAKGVAVPDSSVVTASTSWEELKERANEIQYPLFIKPVCAGSSYGVSRVESEEELAEAIKNALLYDSRVLMEAAIDGFEVGCAIMGDRELTIGEIDEVELSGGFFDYVEKYNLVTSKIHVPARVVQEKADQIKQVAATIYRALGCSGFARVDMFLRPNGEILFNEVNTIPGFTSHSRYPSMMKCAGVSFSELVNRLIRSAVKN